jgi:transcriptional regulator with XRE-family HTH domain
MTPATKPPRFDRVRIGKRVSEARKAAKLTTEELAAKAGIGADSLYKKQRGDQPWYFDELSRVCEILEAPSLFPFLDWETAHAVDKLLGRAK